MHRHLTNCQKDRQSLACGDFSIEIDRILLYCLDPLAAPLLAEKFSLYCLDRSVPHPTAGTASHLIFFENAYLEVVHIENRSLAAHYAKQTGINPLGRADGCKSFVSPFGLGLRLRAAPNRLHSTASELDTQTGSGANHPYRRDPPTGGAVLLSPENLAAKQEPICFVLPNAVALPNLLNLSSSAHQQLLAHPAGVRKVTKIEVTIPHVMQCSKALKMLAFRKLVTLKRGLSPLLELTFDEGCRHDVVDGRPDFPILAKF